MSGQRRRATAAAAAVDAEEAGAPGGESRRRQVDSKFARLESSQDALQQQIADLEWQHKKTKRKVGQLAKGEYIVLEGTEKVEEAYKRCVQQEHGGYAAFKEATPGALVRELGEVLGVASPGLEPQEWTVDKRDPVKPADLKALQRLHIALTRPKQLINVQIQPDRSQKGKGKGKDKGKGKGKDDGKAGKGKGKDLPRKEKHFVLQLKVGSQATIEIRALLEDYLENRLRDKAGLVVGGRGGLAPAAAAGGAAPAGASASSGPSATEPSPEPVGAAAPASLATPTGTANGDDPMAGAFDGVGSQGQRRFLIYVEKTDEEKEWKRQRREEEKGSKGKGKHKDKGKHKAAGGRRATE